MSTGPVQKSDLTAWVPDLLYTGGRFERGRVLVSDEAGKIAAIAASSDSSDDEAIKRAAGEAANSTEVDVRIERLRGRALLPGMVNAHSHAFQRVIRGRTERRSSASQDSFWTWREEMYAAASRLTPEGLYDASRMAFLEMAAGGITTVGEFHYLHRTNEGEEYEDPNLLAKQVVRAARDVGLRIALLRVAYARAGFNQPANERQRRFIEPDSETYSRNTQALIKDLTRDFAHGEAHGPTSQDETRGAMHHPAAWAGVAPHSIRAVRIEQLREIRDFAHAHALPLHMHVAEQPAEIEACLAETRRTPIRYLSDEGLLAPGFTAVHAVHITPEETEMLARSRSTVCACPTTERNLGDGIVPADALFGAGVNVALGTDSHTQIDMLEDARELEYHLRLKHLARNVLAPDDDGSAVSALAARLFACATTGGARSLGLAGGGELSPGSPADFFTVALDDLSIAGAGDEDVLSSIVFSLARTAIRDTVVAGRLVIRDGAHEAQSEIVSRFIALQRALWA